MRKIMYYVHQSLDGFIEGPNGQFDWAQLGPELSDYSMSLAERSSTFLYGRTVWELMSSYWPNAESMNPDEHAVAFAPIWRETEKIVLSTTLESADWNARVIRSAEAINAVKAGPGKDILVTGSASVAAALTELGLLDEYHVIVHPVILGGGKPVYQPPSERIELRLAESRTFDGRTVLLRHDLL
ncbi:dihydrofolate reductase family protein [Kribbella alba]|uniref:Dihydrofolate reductase family protein n=1 Tax=Kribbella alba TaxID=190197 RepID=A0ABN2FEJ9_9ACTN